MPADTSVKFLHSAMAGAPVLSGTAGALISLLDACLVNGFGAVTPDSITIAGGVGTITRGAGLPFEPEAVALISGAAVSGGAINGERKIVAASATTGTFDATGLANQTAIGTISVRLAPAGWAKPFTGTNLAVYRPADITATGCSLRIDDTGTTSARARGFEAMSDVNTGTGPFPHDAIISGGAYWPKSDAASAAGRPWVLVADGRVAYLAVAFGNGVAFGFNAAFGDINSAKSPDAYACLLHGFTALGWGSAGNNTLQDFDDCNYTTQSSTYLARSYAGLGASVGMRKGFPVLGGAPPFKSGNGGLPFPNYADGGLYVSPVNLVEHSTTVFRGAAPGVFGIPQSVGASLFANRDLLTGVQGYAGRSFRVLNSALGCWAFDVTGPWR